MTLSDGPRPAHTAASEGTEPPQSHGHAGVVGNGVVGNGVVGNGVVGNGVVGNGVVGNERLTALAGAVLLVLLVVEIATIARIRALMSAHIVVGVLLVGPLAVKLGSTGYRFVRYYTGAPAYVRKGPPRLALRVLAPLLLLATLVVLGSGIGLVVTGPSQPGPLRALHIISTVIWLPLIAIHVVAYVQRVPRLIADDWWDHPVVHALGRGLRLSVNVGALLAGALAALLVLPAAAPWVAWSNLMGENSPGFLVAGLILATLALLATRPLRWR